MKKLRINCRVTELDTASDIIVRLYNTDAGISGDDYLKQLVTEIEELSENLTTAIKADKIASTLDEADSSRDEVISSLGTLIKGYAVIPVAEKKAHGEKLLAIFTKYKGIASESYANESSLVESMLKDFSSDSITASVSALEGVSELLELLRVAQDTFNSANDAYTAAKTGKSESATSIKKSLLSVINDSLLPYISAMAQANSDLYSDFATKIEAEIEKLNAAITKRSKTTTTTDTNTTESTTE